MTEIRIFAISGSLRKASYNTALVRAAAELAPKDVVFDVYDELREIPMFDDDVRAAGIPASVERLGARLRAAHGVVIAMPEYNYSVPGVLKNALDWASRLSPSPLAGKALGIMGASPGNYGTARSQYHLRQIAVFLDMHPLNKPEVMVTRAMEKFDSNGKLTDEATRKLVETFVVALRDWSKRIGT
jgi:chromate reductase